MAISREDRTKRIRLVLLFNFFASNAPPASSKGNYIRNALTMLSRLLSSSMFKAWRNGKLESFEEEDIAYIGLKEIAGLNVGMRQASGVFPVLVPKAEVERMKAEDSARKYGNLGRWCREEKSKPESKFMEELKRVFPEDHV